MLVHAASEKQQSSRNRRALPPRQTRFFYSFQSTKPLLSVEVTGVGDYLETIYFKCSAEVLMTDHADLFLCLP